jgi:hypothetical protein
MMTPQPVAREFRREYAAFLFFTLCFSAREIEEMMGRDRKAIDEAIGLDGGPVDLALAEEKWRERVRHVAIKGGIDWAAVDRLVWLPRRKESRRTQR